MVDSQYEREAIATIKAKVNETAREELICHLDEGSLTLFR